MTVTVEDGTGLADANAYVAVADCAAYAVARGKTFPTSPVNAAEQAIIRATQGLDGKYGASYPGERLNGRAQALGWPRTDAYDMADNLIASNAVPVEIVQATCEAAIRELATPDAMLPDLERSIRTLKAGSVEIEYGAGATATTTFQIIDGILASLIGAPNQYTASAVRG